MTAIEILREYADDLTAEGASREEIIAALGELQGKITSDRHDLRAIAQSADDKLSERLDQIEFGLI